MMNHHVLGRGLILLALAGWLAAAVGCAAGAGRSSKADHSPASPPPYEGMTLTMQVTTATGRYTYFELDDQGVLWFGGGRHAAAFRAEPAGQLTDQQRQTLWQIVDDHNLLDAGDRPFARSQQVTYQVQLRHNGRRRSFRAIDDQVPGLNQLHDALFQYQADLRYP